jgi:hypothetical protein
MTCRVNLGASLTRVDELLIFYLGVGGETDERAAVRGVRMCDDTMRQTTARESTSSFVPRSDKISGACHLLLYRHHHQAHSAWIPGHDYLRPHPAATSFNQTNRVRAAVVDVIEVVSMLFRVRYRSLRVCCAVNCSSRLDVHVRVVV